MLEDQVAFLLQKYLGNYVRGLNKEALKISVWRGDVELTNMQLRPEALNALKLPVKVKAGFLGSVRIKVPWSRLGQEPVLVYLDRIFIIAEPATQVEGCSEDVIQETKRNRVRELEVKLLESQQQLKPEMNTSWLGSFISTIIGNLKLSITNIHMRYEDAESNLGHPFAAGLTLAKLSAITVDDLGKETFATGVDLDHIQKFVELESLALYFDSDSGPWSMHKPWEDLLPSEWSQVFEFGKREDRNGKDHSYILQPVTGNAKYMKLRVSEARKTGQALQQASVNLDDVTLSLSKDGYRDMLKMADNFSAFNQRLKYAHYRPSLPVKSDPRSWWKYAYKVLTDEMKKASGKLSWEQVLRYARLRKKYVSLYASLLKSDVNRLVADDNPEIKNLDRQLDIDVILQWRMLAHKFLEQSSQTEQLCNKQKTKRSWWSFGWAGSAKDENEFKGFTEEDWQRLNQYIGYKENSDDYLLGAQDKDLIQFSIEMHMKHNASKLITDGLECLADLSCEDLICNVKLYSEAKNFDFKLGSYQLLSPYGLLAKSASATDSFVGIFSYKPLNPQVDWSFVAKASPCYVTYLKESIDQIVSFFKSSPAISQTLALETAAAVQMTIDGVKRSAQQQVTRALKEQSRFLLDLDIAAPKITLPTKFCPDDLHETKLLLDLGNLILRTQEIWDSDPLEDRNLYLQFNLVLSDVSAFLVDGDYHWNEETIESGSNQSATNNFLPVIDKCGVVLKLQQIQSENPFYPATRLAVRLPSLGFHFSPARYHRLMEVAKIFNNKNNTNPETVHIWNQADFEGWLSVLTWKGVGNREAIWTRRYVRLAGPFLYLFENSVCPTYKQWFSLLGKQVYQVPTEITGGEHNILALYDSGQSNPKVLEDASALVLLCDNEEMRKLWHSRLQGAIYRASGSAAISSLSEISSSETTTEDISKGSMLDAVNMEKLFVCGVLDELKICFSCSDENNQVFKKILLSKESNLFEFRAVGGQIELSIKDSNILIGTFLKSLEIEDQYCCRGVTIPQYLARSFINNAEALAMHNVSSSTMGEKSISATHLKKTGSEENFFEASDHFDGGVDSPQHQRNISDYLGAQAFFPSVVLSLKPPSFRRIPGLIPNARIPASNLILDVDDTLDSFVKAQIVIYDQNSPQYNNLDNRVTVSLATLTFYCHRPTILAIMEFVNAINTMDGSDADKHVDKPSTSIEKDALFEEPDSGVILAPAIKQLLGKGKNRVIFHLTLRMAKAQILLMNENSESLTTLSQNNLLTDIKVFPSSFSIKAALGNLKISDDSLPSNHPYFWVCDMRNPGGSSFVEIDFSSFNVDDEDYCGYDYSLAGHLSEVRIVYLNRFVQEIISYFMGLVPRNAEDFVELKDNATNSEKLVSKTDIDGSLALKLDLSLNRPIILMPRRTDSLDYLKLDVLYITVQNTFRWLGGSKNEISAVHLEILTVKVKDINLTVGIDMVQGESIIQDVNGLSVEINRSLRDLLHQVPTIEIAVKIEILKAALSNREYEIITECAASNFSEVPHAIPPLDKQSGSHTKDAITSTSPLATDTAESASKDAESWTTYKYTVAVNLVELSLHSGLVRGSSLASVQANGAWLLYKTNAYGEGSLFATLKGFSVFDDREGTKEQFRLAIGKSGAVLDESFYDDYGTYDEPFDYSSEAKVKRELSLVPTPPMLILDATFKKVSTNVSLCIQRPKFLVVLDFLLAVAEFFVPSIQNILSNEEDKELLSMVSTIVFDDQIYTQTSSVSFLSPQKPLIVDYERFDHYIYDGGGGKLYLQNGDGKVVSRPSTEPIIYVGNGKTLQFRNVSIVNGDYLDSCISLGSDSSYSASEDDGVYLERENDEVFFTSEVDRRVDVVTSKAGSGGSTELIMELQAIGPELTFYSTSKTVGELFGLTTQVMHANADAFCRFVLKGDSFETSASILSLKMESNGIRVLEPFDTSVNYSNASGKTNLHLVVSEVYTNFSFSILRLFIAVEEDILAFLRMSSKKLSVVCSQFDKVGTIKSNGNGQPYAFWRPRAPSGFVILGDCLTPLNEPPSKGVLALNTNLVRVKRPVSYKLIWQASRLSIKGSQQARTINLSDEDSGEVYGGCSIWFPIAPKGYVAMGCVVSDGSAEPPLSSALCVMASLVCSCALKDCIVLGSNELTPANMAFWRVDNSFGSFLPADLNDLRLIGKAYDLRHMLLRHTETSSASSKASSPPDVNKYPDHTQLERPVPLTSGQLFEAIANFQLVWWNEGTSSQKKLSIWRPVVPQGMVYFGDVAVNGYEPPNSVIVLRDAGDEIYLKVPQDFELAGRIKKQRGNEGIHFWYPRAPPGFVTLGCVVSKGSRIKEDFSKLRCIRSDMVRGDHFSEESIWDSSGTRVPEHFSLWTVDNDLATFIVRSGFRKPPKRFALKLAGPPTSSSSDSTTINAEIKSLSAVAFDDYGLMVPLFGISFDNIALNYNGRPDYISATTNFSFAARSFNDRYESWEPVIETTDGFLRYQVDMNTPGAPTQLRMTSTRDLNLNVSASNINMICQAYASWNNLNRVDESYKRENVSRILDVHHRKGYYIFSQNKLGKDIYMRAVEFNSSNIINLPTGDDKLVNVPVSKNLLVAQLKGKPIREFRSMVTVIVAEAELIIAEGSAASEYMTAVRLFSNHPSESVLQQQSARTCAVVADNSSRETAIVNWNEMFFFKVEIEGDYTVEFLVIDIGRGEPVGLYSAPLKQIAQVLPSTSDSDGIDFKLAWKTLAPAMSIGHESNATTISQGIRFAVVLSGRPEIKEKISSTTRGRAGVIQISPSREGPWTTVRLNYAAPTACWRFGNDIIVSEVSVKEGNRYLSIRSLVSVTNNTNFMIDLRLKGRRSESQRSDYGSEKVVVQCNDLRVETDEFIEFQTYDPSNGWVCCPSSVQSDNQLEASHIQYEDWAPSSVKLPDGWEWTDDWHVDAASIGTADGWVYAVDDAQHLKWPEPLSHINSANYVRQRKWIRHRKYAAQDKNDLISLGLLAPGASISLPLPALTSSAVSYMLQLRPKNPDYPAEYSWSVLQERVSQTESSDNHKELLEICVLDLSESENLLFCSQLNGNSNISRALWFCLSIGAKEIGKDIHSDPIHDWNITIMSPLSVVNYLPFSARYTVSVDHLNGESTTCSEGVFDPGNTVMVYNADPRDPMYLALVPQGGWEMIHEPVPISHPSIKPAKYINLRNSLSGRVIQVILEQNYDKDGLVARVIRIYVAYWISCARLPPILFRAVDVSGRRDRGHFGGTSHSNRKGPKVLWQITQEELVDGYTIASTFNFKVLGLSASISSQGKEHFGPVTELSPLGDMDGSVELSAYDTDGNCIRILVSTKPCPYPDAPTKVVCVRPFMTFTNRVGQDLYIKLNVGDQCKILHAYDCRVSFSYYEAGGPDKVQVRLEDTDWCRPVGIVKEDTIVIVLRKQDGGRKFLKAEIRGYEEGSRFLIVFRLGPADGPIRIENRTRHMSIHAGQSGLEGDAWIHLIPLSTSKFCWDDPYGKRVLDVGIQSGDVTNFHSVDLEKQTVSYPEIEKLGVQIRIMGNADLKIVRFVDMGTTLQTEQQEYPESKMIGQLESLSMQNEMQTSTMPLELIIELGVVGVSLIDHRPRELLYFYLQRVFISYLTGYDAGTSNRLKLIIGRLQLDNQLPLTVMPVLLAPEDMPDLNHPVFKANIAVSNLTPDGIQVYPHIHIRVMNTLWKLNIHEPLIWALVDFYSNLHINSMPNNSSVTEVDPEVKIELVDISEIRLKISLETSPSLRPHGVLGIWSPVLSALGSAFKIQVHLRKVVHRSRFMRKSSIIPAILNRVKRDLVHNPLHLIFSVDVLSVTKSTLASLSKGFAELSTDGQFLQLRSKQVWSRRITSVGDGIVQGTEALAQGVAFGLTGVLTKPVESARQHGLFGFAHGLGRAFLGFIVQPLSGALDFVSLTVDGISASLMRCLEVLNNRSVAQRVRNPRAIHADGVIREYDRREAAGQMMLYLAEASRQLGCTDLFREPSKYAWSDNYEDHFLVRYQRIVLITSKRVMLLQGLELDKLDKKPSKILWDVPWEELLALELAKAGYQRPSHLIIHIKNFRRSEDFVKLIKCNVEEDEENEPQAVRICSSIQKMWKAYKEYTNVVYLKVPSSQRHVYFALDEKDGKESRSLARPLIKPRGSSSPDTKEFTKHTVNFQKIWNCEQETRSRCTLFVKQVADGGTVCSIWRPLCPDGYVSIGDVAHAGTHPPPVAAVYKNSDGNFALPIGYDLVWRNCAEDYSSPLTIWLPRPPVGYLALGCVAVATFDEPALNSAYCVSEKIAEETQFEEQIVWTAPGSFPWACYIYQVQSGALQFIALRQPKEESEWVPMRVRDRCSVKELGAPSDAR